jgi:hypothetical protein
MYVDFSFIYQILSPYEICFQKMILKISCVWEVQMVKIIHMFSLQKFITTY